MCTLRWISFFSDNNRYLTISSPSPSKILDFAVLCCKILSKAQEAWYWQAWGRGQRDRPESRGCRGGTGGPTHAVAHSMLLCPLCCAPRCRTWRVAGYVPDHPAQHSTTHDMTGTCCATLHSTAQHSTGRTLPKPSVALPHACSTILSWFSSFCTARFVTTCRHEEGVEGGHAVQAEPRPARPLLRGEGGEGAGGRAGVGEPVSVRVSGRGEGG